MTKENAAPLSEKEVQEIEKRTEAATPGPWTAEWGYAGAVRTLFLNRGELFNGVSFGHSYIPTEIAQHQADTTFSASARQDIPRLIATIRELQQQLAEVKTAEQIIVEVADKNIKEWIAKMEAEDREEWQRLMYGTGHGEPAGILRACGLVEKPATAEIQLTSHHLPPTR